MEAPPRKDTVALQRIPRCKCPNCSERVLTFRSCFLVCRFSVLMCCERLGTWRTITPNSTKRPRLPSKSVLWQWNSAPCCQAGHLGTVRALCSFFDACNFAFYWRIQPQKFPWDKKQWPEIGDPVAVRTSGMILLFQRWNRSFSGDQIPAVAS